VTMPARLWMTISTAISAEIDSPSSRPSIQPSSRSRPRPSATLAASAGITGLPAGPTRARSKTARCPAWSSWACVC
jgi:hypothetical protein